MLTDSLFKISVPKERYELSDCHIDENMTKFNSYAEPIRNNKNMNNKNCKFKLQLPLIPLVVTYLPTFPGSRKSKLCEQSLYLQKNHCMKGTNVSVLSLSSQSNKLYSPVQTTNGNNCTAKYIHLIVQNEDRDCFDGVLSNTSIKTYKDSHDLFLE